MGEKEVGEGRVEDRGGKKGRGDEREARGRERGRNGGNWSSSSCRT